MVMILAAATGTVFFKLYVIDEPPNPNISTFRPLPQQVKLLTNFFCVLSNTTKINPSYGKTPNKEYRPFYMFHRSMMGSCTME